jgi:drug/metabolite transporter (DMT)-like permease
LIGLFNYFLDKKSLSLARLAALVLSAGGLFLLYWTRVSYVSPLGVFFGLIAGVSLALYFTIIDKYGKDIDPLVLNINMGFVSLPFYWFVALTGGGFAAVAETGISPSSWIFVILLGIFVMAVTNTASVYSVRRIGALDASLIFIMEAPCAVVFGFIVFRDILSMGQIFGAVLVLIAAALPHLETRRKGGRN